MMITQQLLVSIDACPSARKVFAETFGDSARLTRRNLIKAAAAGLEIDFLTYFDRGKLAPLHLSMNQLRNLMSGISWDSSQHAEALADAWGLA